MRRTLKELNDEIQSARNKKEVSSDKQKRPLTDKQKTFLDIMSSKVVEYSKTIESSKEPKQQDQIAALALADFLEIDVQKSLETAVEKKTTPLSPTPTKQPSPRKSRVFSADKARPDPRKNRPSVTPAPPKKEKTSVQTALNNPSIVDALLNHREQSRRKVASPEAIPVIDGEAEPKTNPPTGTSAVTSVLKSKK